MLAHLSWLRLELVPSMTRNPSADRDISAAPAWVLDIQACGEAVGGDITFAHQERGEQLHT